jgi:hypothetical protein
MAKTSVLMIVEYSRQLVIYDAGDIRSTFVSFWKATAIFQFGCTCVFLAPLLYKNENQPDKDIRFLQTVGGKSRSLSCACLYFFALCILSVYALHSAPNVQLHLITKETQHHSSRFKPLRNEALLISVLHVHGLIPF